VYGFSPERLGPFPQPVVADSKVFIGTLMGTFYAFDAAGRDSNGDGIGDKPIILKTYKAGGAITHTAGYENGTVFFGAMDGKVYALNTSDLSEKWVFDSGESTGFSNAVLLSDNRVYITNRSGMTYALSQTDGSVVWQRDVQTTVLMSSCLDNGKLYFGAMDMRVYALDTTDGSVAWTSEPFPGTAFKDYWPVCYNNYVILRSYPQTREKMATTIVDSIGPLPASELNKQDSIISAYEGSKSYLKNLFILNQSDGQEAFVVSHWVSNTHNGSVPPPAVDKEGKLIIPVHLKKPDGTWGGSGWGRLDLTQRKVTDLLFDGTFKSGTDYKGTGNLDETLNVSTAGPLVFTFHVQEGNAHFTGMWNTDQQVWTQEGAYYSDQYFWNNNQSRGSSPVSISNGMFFHNTVNNLNARVLTTP